LHFKDIKIHILACEKHERCDLIKRKLWENTCSIAVDVAETQMIFLATLLRDWYEYTLLKIRSLVQLSSCREPSISSETDFGVQWSIFFQRMNGSSQRAKSTSLNFRVRVEYEFWLGLAHPWADRTPSFCDGVDCTKQPLTSQFRIYHQTLSS
jgi:hypothetical protein